MQDLSYFHKSFNLSKLSSYYLTIELSKFGLSYVISDAIRNQHIALKYSNFENPDADIIENFQNLVKDDVYLNKHYKAVNFYLVNDRYTLVPADIFDKKHKKSFLKYNHILQANEEVHFSYIENAQIYNIYVYPSVLINFLVNHFPEIRFFHSTTPFVKLYINNNKNSNNSSETVAINFYPHFFDILVLKNQKILFLNDFSYNTQEDAVYYIMNVIKKLKLNINTIDANIQGAVDNNDKIFQYLNKFLPQLKFKTKFNKEFPFKEVAPNKFANILTEL